MTRMRRTYPNGQEIETTLEVNPIYMSRTRNRSNTNGQSSIGNYEALFKPGTDINETDSLIYEGTETSIQTFDPIIYNGRTYLIKVTFG
jgi:hypothetical protein